MQSRDETQHVQSRSLDYTAATSGGLVKVATSHDLTEKKWLVLVRGDLLISGKIRLVKYDNFGQIGYDRFYSVLLREEVLM